MKMKVKGRIDFLLAGIILLSIFLNFYLLKDAGSNTYYTVAVKSMLTSFHNFFYASFDPAGFITVDKPPVALWIQTLSASLFGLSNFSVLLPEALAGVISVWLMYVIVKHKFGRKAALLSALSLACTPIFVAVVRTNNVDSILIVTLLFAAWALMKSIEKQKLSLLLLSFILVGIGFNVKMLEAYMVLPAFYLFYFIAAKAKWTKRIGQLILATVVLAAVSLSWATTVDMVPKDQRPYIGSSQTNSVLELALGYNGISRLTGDKPGHGKGGGQGMPWNTKQRQGMESQFGSKNKNAPQNMHNMNADQMQKMQKQAGSKNPFQISQKGDKQAILRHGGMGGGMFGTGTPGVTRLFSKALSGQISWLLPFVLFAVIGLVVSLRKTKEFTMQHKFATFWLAWLIPMMIFFSIAGFFHQYYLSIMGPAIAGLVGIGWTVLWDFYKKKQGWANWLLPVSILATALFETLILLQNKEAVSKTWIAAAVIVGVVLFTLLIFFRNKVKTAYCFSIAGVIALLILPFYWGFSTVLHGGNSTMPVAGPVSQSSWPMMGGKTIDRQLDSMQIKGHGAEADHIQQSQWQNGRNRGMMGDEVDPKLLSYLEKHYHGEKFMLAVERATTAEPYMLKTDHAVMAMGGFMGNDPVLTPEKLEKIVKAGEVKYFLISSGMGMEGNQKITEWIEKNCEAVPASKWQSTNKANNKNDNQPFSRGQNITLYVYKG
ncbi:glycosyltransferase family 39 protein [Scopulibacillus cellulosilyticus]|uniref:Glycosyltransferase family 39 protein n=1 Tax=Scopulibacillus cellulosilyticus TaxID=2665665 RepID=A0ABW2Q106_9BACL